jgi:hypothetical protein
VCLAYGTHCPWAGTGVSLGALVATHLVSQRGRWTCRPERDLTRPLPLEMCHRLITPPLHSAQAGLAEDELEVTDDIVNGHPRRRSIKRHLHAARP